MENNQELPPIVGRFSDTVVEDIQRHFGPRLKPADLDRNTANEGGDEPAKSEA